jgi:hypothetical protein
MSQQHKNGSLPRDAIQVDTYRELHHYLAKFADGEFGLVLLLGRPGTAKTESVKQIVGYDVEEQGRTGPTRRVFYVEGHAQPFGFYCGLWEYRDCLVVIDDPDQLYANPGHVRILKPLCSTRPVKRITWYSKAAMADDGPPPSFVTSSKVILIANEWRTLNANVRALEDRAIIIHFAPGNNEVHRQVATWFDDQEVFDFMADHLANIPELSMRHYEKGRMLRRAGVPDWRTRLLQIILPDKRVAVVAALQTDPAFRSDKERIERFIRQTGLSRPTYYRIKQGLPASCTPVPVIALSSRAVSSGGSTAARTHTPQSKEQ